MTRPNFEDPEENDVGAGQILETPHNHDVLCGRGGMTNSHIGNEWFRRLVRSNRPLYRSCPKHTKLLVAKAIVQAVQQQEPSGRFLEGADKSAGTWRQITYKRAVDKTSQALREKEQPADKLLEDDTVPNNEVAQLAAEAAKRKGKKKEADLSDLTQATLRQAGLVGNSQQQEAGQVIHEAQSTDLTGKRKAQESVAGFIKPPWWRHGRPSVDQSSNIINGYGDYHKRAKTELEESTTLPPESLQVRQSSMFPFLNGSGIFGRNEAVQQPGPDYVGISRPQRSSGLFSFSEHKGRLQPNASDLISQEAAVFEMEPTNRSNMRLSLNARQSLGMGNLDPLPINSPENGVEGRNVQELQQGFGTLLGERAQGIQMEDMPTAGLFPQRNSASAPGGGEEIAPPPMNRLTTQVSDWLTSFFPTGKDQHIEQQRQQGIQQEQLQFQPPPPGDNLERSISSTLFNFARTPSQFLTNLKSGVTSMFASDDLAPIPLVMGGSNIHSIAGIQSQARPSGSPPVMGTTVTVKRDSLLDDYEETPLETRLRSVTSD